MRLLPILSLLLFTTMSYASTTNYNNATNSGQALGALLAGQGSAATSQSGETAVMNNLGTQVTSVGSESSEQMGSMGAQGDVFATFNFKVKPECSGTQFLHALHGSYIEIPCQASSGVLQAKVCLNDLDSTSLDCNNPDNYQPMNLPANNNPVTEFGYQFNGLCNKNGLCTGKMSKDASVVTNSSDIEKQSMQAAGKSGIYNMIKQSYLGKDGYSKTQAYMSSFGDDGSNNLFAKCTANTAGVFKNGIYYSCDGDQSDSFSGVCKLIKSCTDWELVHHDSSTTKSCKLTPNTKPLNCKKYPKVTVTNKTYTELETYSGNMTNTGERSNTVTLPQGGYIQSFTFKSRSKQGYRGWSSYVFSLNGVNIGTMKPVGGDWTSWINISAKDLNVLVGGGGIVNLSFVGYSDDARYEAPYTLTELVTKKKKVATTTWITDCPTS